MSAGGTKVSGAGEGQDLARGTWTGCRSANLMKVKAKDKVLQLVPVQAG